MRGAVSRAQLRALELLAPLLDPDAYLAGGVAVALRAAHRSSKDLDVFTPSSVLFEGDALALAPEGVRVMGRASGTLELEVLGVPTTVLRYRYPLLAPPEPIDGVSIRAASLDDLVAMKLSAISQRGLARDFWDLHELLALRSWSMDEALDAFRRKYRAEDIGHVVRSLAYFGDAEAEPLPAGLGRERLAAIEADFRRWVLALKPSTPDT